MMVKQSVPYMYTTSVFTQTLARGFQEIKETPSPQETGLCG